MTQDDKWRGCYGQQVGYTELDQFIEDCFLLDDVSERAGVERFGTNIIGHTGIGKTSKIKQFAAKPVEWRGKKYDGFDVRSVPIAQFEEMGDLHGLPIKHLLVKRATQGKEMEERWVPLEVVKGYTNIGWGIDHGAGVRTMYAPPDWVPLEPGPCILNLDDWNRANGRIIKGSMQFLQEYGLMSWKLPPGCHITLTMNPDEQDYFVTTVDAAVLQRLRSCTLKFDAKEWAVWATRSGIDQRVVSFVLAYPEIVTTGTRNSPRSISEFGRFLAEVPGATPRRMQVMAASVLDDDLVTALITFMDRDFEMVVTPEDILAGKKSVYAHLKDLMSRKEKRIDVVGVTVDRLFAHLSRDDVKPDNGCVENVQTFLKSQYLEAEMRYVFVDRLNKASDKDPKMDKWFMGDRELMELIMELV
jgi:MoxR-like ATPase